LRAWVKGKLEGNWSSHLICDRATRDGKRPIVAIVSFTKKGTFDWTQVTLDRIKLDPKYPKGVMVTLCNRAGELWFDDVELVEVK